ncbi:unnamed protein product [Cuscuta epithymum]|uniref:Uncharacterized protein n=1 Tax=Cuscuta epithymum TaxID=186058 RepID=A0AAV0ET19_9ASTE|nr:unnamed protein product [Cuscuta epithymum]
MNGASNENQPCHLLRRRRIFELQWGKSDEVNLEEIGSIRSNRPSSRRQSAGKKSLLQFLLLARNQRQIQPGFFFGPATKSAPSSSPASNTTKRSPAIRQTPTSSRVQRLIPSTMAPTSFQHRLASAASDTSNLPNTN